MSPERYRCKTCLESVSYLPHSDRDIIPFEHDVRHLRMDTFEMFQGIDFYAVLAVDAAFDFVMAGSPSCTFYRSESGVYKSGV